MYFDHKPNLHTVFSPWKIPLPLEEYTSLRVVVYYLSNNKWVPIKYCTLKKAIKLSYEGRQLNQELFLFTVDLNPNDFDDFFDGTIPVKPFSLGFKSDERLNLTQF